MSKISTFIRRLAVAPIKGYQRVISPMRPATCRFYPSCSAYAVRAIEVHGIFVGSYLGLRRLLRCHPWTPGGVDHVPPRGKVRQTPIPYDPSNDDDTSTATRVGVASENASSLMFRPIRTQGA